MVPPVSSSPDEKKQAAPAKKTGGIKKLKTAMTKVSGISAIGGVTMAELEGGGEPIGKHGVQLMLAKAIGDAVEQF